MSDKIPLEVQITYEQAFFDFYTKVMKELPQLKEKYPNIESPQFQALLQLFYSAGRRDGVSATFDEQCEVLANMPIDDN